MSDSEMGSLWLAEEISVVSPSRMSENDVSRLDKSPVAVAVAKTGTSIEVTTLL